MVTENKTVQKKLWIVMDKAWNDTPSSLHYAVMAETEEEAIRIVARKTSSFMEWKALPMSNDTVWE